jgi:hypothetical protein
VEVFFEAVELEEVGEFEGANVAAFFADFLLEVGDDATEVLRAEARPEELVPEPLAIEAQGEFLAGKIAVKVVDLGNLAWPVLSFRRRVHGGGD